MLDIILWSLLAFFGVFGIIEFIRFVYTDWKECHNNYHIVISTKNKEENIEAVIRNTILATDSTLIIVIDDNSSAETKSILKKLRDTYNYIQIMNLDEYLDFLNSKEC